jgi:hypothetical protein
MTDWKTLKQAGAYLSRSPRFVGREIKAGRLRAARIGGRGEYLTCDRWLDEYVEAQARPIEVVRRRA